MGHDRRHLVGDADLGGAARTRQRLAGLLRPTRSTGCATSASRARSCTAIAANPTAYASSFNDIAVGQQRRLRPRQRPRLPGSRRLRHGLGPRLAPADDADRGQCASPFTCATTPRKLAPPVVTGLSPAVGADERAATRSPSPGPASARPASPDVAGVQVGSCQATCVAVRRATRRSPPCSRRRLPRSPPGSPRPDDGAGPAAVVVTLTSGESSFPSAASMFEYVDENAGAGADPERDEHRAERGARVLARSRSRSTARASPAPRQVSFGGVAAAGVHRQEPLRDHSHSACLFHPGLRRRCRRRACTRARTPRTTSARCKSS